MKLAFFSKLAPCQKDESISIQIMSNLAGLVPLGSCIEAAIKILADGSYETVLTINSTAKQFRTESNTSAFFSSLKQAESRMLILIQEWKKKRFDHVQ